MELQPQIKQQRHQLRQKLQEFLEAFQQLLFLHELQEQQPEEH